MTDIRWQQRFENFEKAYNNFLIVIEALKESPENIINKMAIIQAYEMVFELGWKTTKDFLIKQGVEVSFPREVIKEAFAYEIIDNGEIWIKMLDDRNLTVHTYDEAKANAVISDIKNIYFFEIEQLYNYLKGKL